MDIIKPLTLDEAQALGWTIETTIVPDVPTDDSTPNE